MPEDEIEKLKAELEKEKLEIERMQKEGGSAKDTLGRLKNLQRQLVRQYAELAEKAFAKGNFDKAYEFWLKAMDTGYWKKR